MLKEDGRINLTVKDLLYECGYVPGFITEDGVEGEEYSPQQIKLVDGRRWICTDRDRQQYGRKLCDGHYEFREANPAFLENPSKEDPCIEMDIILDHYTDKQIENHVAAYYKSVAEVKEIYGRNWEWIVAECIFEQESGLY